MYPQMSPPPPPPPGYNQPPLPPYAADVPSPRVPQTSWSSKLCDCTVDIPSCCLTLWCPCIVFGQIAEIVDKGNRSCGVHGAIYTISWCLSSCTNRTKMRRQYRLPEEPTNDCCVHVCCSPCALCQEYRELQHLGFDMSIGWQGNMDRMSNNGSFQIPPMAHGGMNR